MEKNRSDSLITKENWLGWVIVGGGVVLPLVIFILQSEDRILAFIVGAIASAFLVTGFPSRDALEEQLPPTKKKRKLGETDYVPAWQKDDFL